MNQLNKDLMESIIIKIISGWILASLYFGLKNLDIMLNISSVSNVDLLPFAGIMMTAIVVLGLLERFLENRWIGINVFLVLVITYAGVIIYCSTNLYVTLGITAMVILVFRYFMHEYEKEFSKIRLNKRIYRLIIFSVIGLWMFIVIGLTVLRYMTFRTPCYDFGIFSQMFYYMKNTFVPLVTCERDQLLSHFNVHMSPALYLLLPFYMIFPNPVTLLVLQALAIISGIIPLYLLCKQKKLTKGITTGICLVYILYPAMAGGCFYDFHENKLLLPILLWLFYFIEKKKNIGIAALTMLTLFVKEDAGIYVACIGLYVILSKKELKKGVTMLGVSILYFFAVVFYLEHYGDGAMLGRYANYMPNDGGITEMLTVIIKNPAYLIGQIFTQEKFEFLLWMLIPIGGIVFKTRRISDYLLLIPLLVMNLMSNNPYQHSIYYQYTYGVIAILFYLLIENIGVMIQQNKIVEVKKHLVYMCIAAGFLFISSMGGKLFYLDEYNLNKNVYKVMREELDKIPKDASVEATTWQVPYLSQREVIYKLDDTNFKGCDYVVFDLRSEEFQDLYDESQEMLNNLNYLQITKHDGILAVYYRKNE